MRRFTLCLSLLCGCSQATSSPHEVTVGQTVALQPGQSVTIAGSKVALWLTQVSESRCPSDVQCISAGEALSVLELSGAEASRTDTLRIVKDPKSTTYGGYRISVVSVLPYPQSTKPPATKTVTLLIER